MPRYIDPLMTAITASGRAQSSIARKLFMSVLLVIMGGSAFAGDSSALPSMLGNFNAAVQSSVAPAPGDCNPATGICDAAANAAFITRNYSQTFSQKFAVVTTDWNQLSHKNIKHYEEMLTRLRPKFPEYLREADKKLAEIDHQIKVIHQTSTKSALGIIRSGAVLSLDELIRRKVFPPGRLLTSTTKPELDGQIGEQDVVFLAITNPASDDAAFGNITFDFDKAELLARGYFTPYAFGMGSPVDWDHLHKSCYSRVLNDPVFRNALRLYRNVIFSGTDDYRKWLRLSIAEVLWENDQPNLKAWRDRAAKLMEKVDANQNKCNALTSDTSTEGQEKLNACFAEGYPRKTFDSLYKALGQPFPAHAPDPIPYSDSSLPYYFSQNATTPDGLFTRIFESYAAFPWPDISKTTGLTYFDKPMYAFWELKVPTQVPLKLLKGIEINESDPAKKKELQQAIGNWAAKQGFQTAVSEHGDVTRIDLIKH